MLEGESVVIDANIVQAVYSLDQNGSFATTESPGIVMDDLRAQSCKIVLDDGGKVIQEWKNTVGNIEWFESFYMDLVMFWNVVEIKADPHLALCRELRTKHGFPKKENIWLVKTSVTEAPSAGACVLLSEDVDFRQPDRKGAKDRMDYIRGKKKGTVYKLLKSHSVEVLALCQCC